MVQGFARQVFQGLVDSGFLKMKLKNEYNKVVAIIFDRTLNNLYR
jgi:hypothetical protein